MAPLDVPPPLQKPVNRFYQGVWPVGDYRFFQLAWVVDDLMATMTRWTKVYGVGPFHVMPKRKQTARYRGQTSEIEMQLAVTQSGPVQLEFIQQIGGDPSVYREIYPEGQGGLHHMCTITQAYDDTVAHYERLGYPVIAEIQGGFKVGYCDTKADFGFITEIVEHTDGFVAALTAINETCAAWDGRDPIRLLTRDGYRTP
jgi:hypothetical protein